MAATNFKTENNTFRKLIGNGLSYRIPRFQRDYSWTQEEWEDLWQDLLGTVQPGGEPAHYMGYLVLQSSDDKTFEVIDGQQRLTTISILVLAVLKNLQRLVDTGDQVDANRTRSEQIRNSYIGFLDPVTLVARSKLTLNRNNNSYWQSFLVPLGSLPTGRFRASEHALRRAFEWFDRAVTQHVANEQDKGRALAWFLESASDRLFFTVITVTDELNAYRVFETLNSRGVRLSATDLLKNYLFSVLDRDQRVDHELDALEERWEALVVRLGAEDFPDFLRVHWNSRRGFARQADLFKTIRAQIGDRGSVFELLRQMEEDLDHYLALVQPEDSTWTPEAKEQVRNLLTFQVKRPFSMLIAARRRFVDEEFVALLRDCVVLAFRANVICGWSAGEQERLFSEAALRLAEQTAPSRHEVLDLLRPVYPNDKAFIGSFAEKGMRTTQARNNKVVRYLLGKLERHVSARAELQVNSDTLSVEHVLPQHPGPEWGQMTAAEVEALVYRLGNMTLLSTKDNNRAGAGDWTTKRAALQNSEFALSRRLAEENAEWNAERIAARQMWMAKQAAAIWRIDRLA
ncbi:MAG: DUF262 domain-containing HNH endonuclease family protein [Planctomycetes bacterium]|nr:DUF262 domain-containing HNH endonuclease family protein [Planctomycetota bacterium]MCC7399037.1 DUF262 domain-containing protein [Planctomycetota bacterium]